MPELSYLPRIILASASPRRIELLTSAGISFETEAADIEEPIIPGVPPEKLVAQHAQAKAFEIAQRHPDALVIGADTLVYLKNIPLGKPRDRVHARLMLQDLSGKKHYVYTGVWLISLYHNIGKSFTVQSEVQFLKLSPLDIENYLALVDPLDKAGSYAAQEHGERIIHSISGSISNVIGLPVERLLQELNLLNEEFSKKT